MGDSLEGIIKKTQADMNAIRDEQQINEFMGEVLKDEAKGILQLLELIGSKSYTQVATVLRQEIKRRKEVLASLRRSLREPLSPRLKAAIIADIEFYTLLAGVFES